MPDAINRLVSSSVFLNRPFWYGKERQRQREKENGGETLALRDEPFMTQASDGNEPVAADQKSGKGRHLDISV